MVQENLSSKGQAWFCNTGLSVSDVTIEVDDMAFHLHKLPLVSKSRKLSELVSKQERKNRTRARTIQRHEALKSENDIDEGKQQEIQEQDEDDEEQEYHDDDEDGNDEDCHITLANFPGGSETFESAAKFCYSVKIDISSVNAASLLCAAEYLQMTEDHSEDNLIARTERFLSQSVFKNIRSSIKALSSCQKLLPMAEELGIVDRCIDAVVSRAPDSDPTLFGWPVNEITTVEETGDNGRRKLLRADRSWLDELGNLSVPFFKRLISAMKASNLSAEIVDSCLIHYARKYIPGISRSGRKYSSSSSSRTTSSSSGSSEWSQRELLETIVSNLTSEKTSNATRYLFGLLRSAYILNVSEVCKSTLEKKIGSELEHATLDDLLIPSYSYLNETLYDVDCVERMLGFFLERLMGEDDRSDNGNALMLVGKLIDGYLSEIASDGNLKPDKFYDLAVALPDRARIFDDGLYRAVDVFLKAHPWIPEAEREKITGVLDWQKLTLEACTHAAQNERLPLRAVVQVLFFEQLQLRHAIAGTLAVATQAEGGGEENDDGGDGGEEDRGEGGNNDRDPAARAGEGAGTWRAAVRENQVLRADMASMRTRVHELERECTNMKKAMEKIDDNGGHVERGGWRAKFGCKFKTQVCDSHGPSTVGGPKSRARKQQQRRQQQ